MGVQRMLLTPDPHRVALYGSLFVLTLIVFWKVLA